MPFPVRRLSGADPSLALLLALVLSACTPRMETAESSALDATVATAQGAGTDSARPGTSAITETKGADAPAVLSQGELVEVLMNLECASSLENRCQALVRSDGPKPYLFLWIRPNPTVARERRRAAEEILMAAVRRFNITPSARARFPWLDTVVLERGTSDPFTSELARVSLVRSGDTTPYEGIYERIGWVQRKAFAPGVTSLEVLPLSAPWRN